MLRTGLDIKTGLRNLEKYNDNKNIEMKEKITGEGAMVSFMMEKQNNLRSP